MSSGGPTFARWFWNHTWTTRTLSPVSAASVSRTWKDTDRQTWRCLGVWAEPGVPRARDAHRPLLGSHGRKTPSRGRHRGQAGRGPSARQADRGLAAAFDPSSRGGRRPSLRPSGLRTAPGSANPLCASRPPCVCMNPFRGVGVKVSRQNHRGPPTPGPPHPGVPRPLLLLASVTWIGAPDEDMCSNTHPLCRHMGSGR